VNIDLACEREFVKKEERGGFLSKNFGGYAIKLEEKGGVMFVV
jgi:hypothetical protein